MTMRVGLGVDAHALEVGIPLMLGTVRVAHSHGLAGHSDGDVVAHALCDALLAAAGGPDIGAVFPSGDPSWAGVSGEAMIGEVMRRLGDDGWTVVNAHAVVMCEAPRVAPHRDAMERSMSALVGAPVTVHATTTDHMGFVGRREGIACQVVAMVERA